MSSGLESARADEGDCRFCARQVPLHWVPGGHFGICDQCLDDVERRPPEPLSLTWAEARPAAD